MQKLKSIGKAVLPGIIISPVIVVLMAWGIFETMELKSLDHRFHRYAHRLTPRRDIVIITVDQNSIDYFRYRLGIVWKWPRDVYGRVISYLSRAGAKAILMDFDFSDPDIDRAEFEPGETDRLLARAIAGAGNVVNSAILYRELHRSSYSSDNTAEAIRPFALEIPGAENLRLEENTAAVAPLPPILMAGRALGISNILPDRDGIIRKARLLHRYRDAIYPHSSLAVALMAINEQSVTIEPGPVMKLGGMSIPLTDKGEIYINWYGAGGPESGTYRYYPIADVLLSDLRTADGLDPIIPMNEFRDRIVLVGSSAPSLYDLKATPFSDERAYPGVEIVATITNNLLAGEGLKRLSPAVTAVFTVLSIMFSTVLIFFMKSVIRSTAVTIGLMVAAYYATVWAFYNNIFMDMVPLETGILLSFIAVTVLKYLTEGREKRWLRKAFSQYLSPTVIEEIMEHPEKLQLGGEKREVTVMFSDIRGFTSLSEKLEPEQITNILNEYFTPMSEIIFRHNGTLDKYIGDAIMAFFGAPIPAEDHERLACKAALDMIKSLEELKEMWRAKNMPPFIQELRIGIGINSGPVVVGNMGSESRFDYTIIGDNVNLASRLEGINKFYGTSIVISENTYRKVKDEFICMELDYIKVAGKSIPIRIYELITGRDRDSVAGEIETRARRFEEGLALYRNRRWNEAIGVFEELHAIEPYRKVYTVFIERCGMLKNRTLPPDWDGVFERRVK